MKFKRHSKLEHGLAQIDIAPMIDVIFQLLIFFMLSSSFTIQTGINVKLPKTVTSDVIQVENLTVTISQENIVYLNNKIISLAQLEETLEKGSSPNRSLLIKADRRSSVGRIVDVWDLCRKLGIERINIATNPE